MSDLLTKDLISYDPLSETTRRERRALLGLSILGLAIVKVPLVPEKFAMLGIEFAKLNQATFVGLYALIVGYFLVAFCIYALTDYIAWKRQGHITYTQYTMQQKERERAMGANIDELLTDETTPVPVDHKRGVGFFGKGNPVYRGFAAYRVAEAAAALRAAFEFLLPIGFALYALVVLLRYVATLKAA